MVLTFVLGWPLIQLIITMIGNSFSDDKFDVNRFWLKTRKWEDGGNFYKRVFKIHYWKHLLPDGARTNKNGFRKKRLKALDGDYLKAFITETCRAEVIHWFQRLPFWVLGFWCPPFVLWIMLGYALLVNFPCILAQRYNRPRLIKLFNQVSRKRIS